MSKPASEEDLVAARVEAHLSRDLSETARMLEQWLALQMPGARDLRVAQMTAPSGGGGSSETFFFTLEANIGGEACRRRLVLRIDPTDFRLFLRRNFDAQHRLLDWLAQETDIPVPPIRFYEAGAQVLGAPFWVMDHVKGDIPPDNPTYNAGGFLFEASPGERRRLWRSGMDILGKLARLDGARLPAIIELQAGESGQHENLRHWTESMSWACAGYPPAHIRKANEWLWENLPRRQDTGLSWGDARIGNMIFRDWACVGVLDWETITLAGPQLDLAHWLLMDDYSAECLGLERLAGLGTRAETIALWEELSGRVADQLDWHELLAVYRLSIVMERYTDLWAKAGRGELRDANGDTLMSRHLRKVYARVACG